MTKSSSGKRNQLELMLELLLATREPVKRTRLIYRLQVNHYQLQRYTRLLLKHGIIEETDHPFRGLVIRAKGRVLLDILDALQHNAE